MVFARPGVLVHTHVRPYISDIGARMRGWYRQTEYKRLIRLLTPIALESKYMLSVMAETVELLM